MSSIRKRIATWLCAVAERISPTVLTSTGYFFSTSYASNAWPTYWTSSGNYAAAPSHFELRETR